MKKAIYICMIFSICYSLNLTLLDYHDPLAHHILDAEVVDNTLIISATVQGIEFYDISDPTQLNHISHFTLSSGGGGGGGGTKSNCVTAENGYAYFSSNNGVYVVDISNLNNPINYGSINGTDGLILENLKVKDDLLIVAAHEDGASLYNVSNPTNPIYLSTIPTNNSWAVDIMEGYAFIADEENILVVDISNLSSPEIITEIVTGNAIKDIEIDDIFIYVGPLRPSMALIQQADLMVDNCSGPSHISAALQVPTLVLMGVDFKNTYRDENIYKYRHFLFFRDVPCRDLFLSKCLPPDPCQNRICMDHSVEEVFKKAQELLE